MKEPVLTVAQIRDELERVSGRYSVKVPYVDFLEDQKKYGEHRRDVGRVERLFRRDSLRAVGLVRSDWEFSEFDLAWDVYRDAGLISVLEFLEVLAKAEIRCLGTC